MIKIWKKILINLNEYKKIYLFNKFIKNLCYVNHLIPDYLKI